MSKEDVLDFWDRASCGEELYLGEGDYQSQADERYRLEPYIKTFIDPKSWNGAKVLEIGVGLGADHQLLAENGAVLSGVDLTPRAVQHTKERFRRLGLKSGLRVADAENLPFSDETFDMVYSWGVIHHSPDTYKAVREIFRVLKPNGTMKVMIYHKWSLIGLMLWLRYGLAIGRPLRSLDDIYACHLESPGTKAYSRRYARETLFMNVPGLKIATLLTHGDLLESEAGQRHRGALLTLARKLWPRWFFRRFFPDSGLFMLIEARKYGFGDPPSFRTPFVAS